MIDDTRVLSKSLAYSLIGLVGFFGVSEAILLTFGGSLPPHYTPLVAYFVYLSAFLVNPLFMILGTRLPLFKLLAIAWFQLTMGVLLVWFNDLQGPFTALWTMLILLASIYDGWRGFTVSSVFLVFVGAVYCLLFYDQLRPTPFIYIVVSGMVIAMTIVASYVFTRILMNSRRKNRELTQAQESELLQVNRLNTLLNSISDAVLTLNRYGRITSQNAAAQVFFDTNESLIGRDIDKLFVLTDGDNAQVRVRSLIDSIKSSSIRDDLSVGAGGDMRHLSLQMAKIGSTFGDSEEYGVVLIIRDITKQKTLEDEKDEFISVTSHELRTPVAIAEGSLSNFLLMQERGVSQDKLAEAAGAAYKQITYLAQMINDLSTLSRAERGVGDSIEPVDVKELLYNLFTKYTPEAQEKNLHLDLDTEHNLPQLETSRLYLEEVMQNFITNAIKYTKKGSVTFGAKMESGDAIRFFVKDSGIGISKSDMQHIFERFYRSEDYRTRETSGTGLGLYVVEKLATKLGTKVDVESRLNVGSTFSFRIPLRSNRLPSVETKVVEESETSEPKPVSQEA